MLATVPMLAGCLVDSLNTPSCFAWRQTGGCSAAGPREPCNDQSCSASIGSGLSGDCDCGDGRIALECGHAPTTCATLCRAGTPTSECVSWRQTGASRADGPREPLNDRPCDTWIPADFSGFCECRGRNVPFGSQHSPFTCGAVCAGASVVLGQSCRGNNSSGGGGGGGGCSADSDCGRCQRCERSTGRCISRLTC